MKARTKEIMVSLKKLSAEGEKNLFQRVKLAAELLEDFDWIAEFHDGNEDMAAEAVQASYFASLCGYVPLLKVVAIYRKYPKETIWQEYAYNLKALELIYDADRKQEAGMQKSSVKRATLAQMAELEAQLSEAKAKGAAAKAELDTLREEAQKLREENAQLRVRLVELDRILNGVLRKSNQRVKFLRA